MLSLSHLSTTENNETGTFQGAQTTSRSSTSVESLATATKTASTTITAVAKADSTGLAEGAKIGIGVGISLGVTLCVLFGLAAYLLLRRRRTQDIATGDRHSSRAEIDGTIEERPRASYKELHGASSHKELSGESARKELSGTTVLAHEMSVSDS